MDELSVDEEAVLRFLRDQLLKQATYVRVTRDDRHLRAQMTQTRVRFATYLSGSPIAATSEPRTGWFAHDEPTTCAYRLTERGDQALADF
jgi:hypothetical protein